MAYLFTVAQSTVSRAKGHGAGIKSLWCGFMRHITSGCFCRLAHLQWGTASRTHMLILWLRILFAWILEMVQISCNVQGSSTLDTMCNVKPGIKFWFGAMVFDPCWRGEFEKMQPVRPRHKMNGQTIVVLRKSRSDSIAEQNGRSLLTHKHLGWIHYI